MSCCCSNPKQALLAAAIFTLVISAPSGFYGLVQVAFHVCEECPLLLQSCIVLIMNVADHSELTHKALSILSTATCVASAILAVFAIIARYMSRVSLLSVAAWVAAACSCFAVVMTLWAAAVETQDRDGAEGKILAAGTVILLSLAFAISPLSWLTYEIYAFRRQFNESGLGRSRELEGKSFISDKRQAQIDGTEHYSQSQPPAPVFEELGRPRGRTRRGKAKRYSHVSSKDTSSGDDRHPTYGLVREG
ncbi:uncharacterized protein JCM15063_004235 [Sporobolomyces koalae]|uniref:uncharacterized protein n=1 Tax=Sporobolomyces koalae TaxID=500713 RepID=UPI003170F192